MAIPWLLGREGAGQSMEFSCYKSPGSSVTARSSSRGSNNNSNNVGNNNVLVLSARHYSSVEVSKQFCFMPPSFVCPTPATCHPPPEPPASTVHPRCQSALPLNECHKLKMLINQGKRVKSRRAEEEEGEEAVAGAEAEEEANREDRGSD